MITHTLSITSPGSEDYDELYPTKQTELLCLELRKILYGLDGAVVHHAEDTDLTDVETVVNGIYSQFVDEETAATDAFLSELPVPVPESPVVDIIGTLSGLVLSGVVSPVAALAIKIVLPLVSRVIARKLGVPGYSGQAPGQDITPQLEVIAERIAADGGSVWSALDEQTNFLAELTTENGYRKSVLKTYEADETELNQGMSVFCGLTALGERLSAITRIVEELQSIMESKTVAIMHTSEADKVVYITD